MTETRQLDDRIVQTLMESAVAGGKSDVDAIVLDAVRELKDWAPLLPTPDDPDGVYLGLYEALFADRTRSPVSVFVPETVVYRRGRPVAWYTCARDEGSGRFIVNKRRPTALKNTLILRQFLLRGAVQQATDPRLQPRCCLENPNAAPSAAAGGTTVVGDVPRRRKATESPFIAVFVSRHGTQYLDAAQLKPFVLLGGHEPAEGVLQQFVEPASPSDPYEVIRVAWSPHMAYVERRRNVLPLRGADPKKYTEPPLGVPTGKDGQGQGPLSPEQQRERTAALSRFLQRVETFDGHRHVNTREWPVTSAMNLEALQHQATAVARHLNDVTGGQLAVQSMTLALRLSQASEPVLLWAESVRLLEVLPLDGPSASAPDGDVPPGGEVVSATHSFLRPLPAVAAFLRRCAPRPPAVRPGPKDEEAEGDGWAALALRAAATGASDTDRPADLGLRCVLRPWGRPDPAPSDSPQRVHQRAGPYSLEVQHKQHAAVAGLRTRPCEGCAAATPHGDVVALPYRTVIAAVAQARDARRTKAIVRDGVQRPAFPDDLLEPFRATSTSASRERLPTITAIISQDDAKRRMPPRSRRPPMLRAEALSPVATPMTPPALGSPRSPQLRSPGAVSNQSGRSMRSVRSAAPLQPFTKTSFTRAQEQGSRWLRSFAVLDDPQDAVAKSAEASWQEAGLREPTGPPPSDDDNSDVERYTAAFGARPPVPPLLRRLHPLATPADFVAYRGRDDFLSTTADLCPACVLKYTHGMAAARGATPGLHGAPKDVKQRRQTLLPPRAAGGAMGRRPSYTSAPRARGVRSQLLPPMGSPLDRRRAAKGGGGGGAPRRAVTPASRPQPESDPALGGGVGDGRGGTFGGDLDCASHDSDEDTLLMAPAPAPWVPASATQDGIRRARTPGVGRGPRTPAERARALERLCEPNTLLGRPQSVELASEMRGDVRLIGARPVDPRHDDDDDDDDSEGLSHHGTAGLGNTLSGTVSSASLWGTAQRNALSRSTGSLSYAGSAQRKGRSAHRRERREEAVRQLRTTLGIGVPPAKAPAIPKAPA